MVTKQIASFTKDLKPVSIIDEDKKRSAIKLLKYASSKDINFCDSINIDGIWDEPIVSNASPNVKKGAPKEAIILDRITRKEKTTKYDAVIITKSVTKLTRSKISNWKVSNEKQQNNDLYVNMFNYFHIFIYAYTIFVKDEMMG